MRKRRKRKINRGGGKVERRVKRKKRRWRSREGGRGGKKTKRPHQLDSTSPHDITMGCLLIIIIDRRTRSGHLGGRDL